MSTLWILVANRGFARIYEAKGHGREIKEILFIDNIEGHVKGSLELSDRPGRTFDRIGYGRHALEDKNIHAHEQLVFIQNILSVLEEGKHAKAYNELALVVPPVFLGELNKHISNDLRKIIIKEVRKDLPENISEKDRIEHLRKYLDLWNESATPRVTH